MMRKECWEVEKWNWMGSVCRFMLQRSCDVQETTAEDFVCCSMYSCDVDYVHMDGLLARCWICGR